MDNTQPLAMMLALLRRQLTLALRRPVQLINPLLFFAIVIVLFPIGLGPQQAVLAQFAPGILWIVALLAAMLAADSLFSDDFADGSLEQLLLAPQPLYLLVLPYLISHWLLTGVLLALISPLFALVLGLPVEAIPMLVISLILGTGVMSVLGGVGSALTVGLRRGGMLIALIIAPFYVPVLILGVGAVEAVIAGRDAIPLLALMGSGLSLAIALGPIAISAGLRISAEG